MASEFKFIDHPADIAIEISGSNYKELFLAAVNGLVNSLLEPAKSTREKTEKKFSLEEDSVEELLVSYLAELNYFFESKKIFPLEVNLIQIKKTDKAFRLTTNIVFGSITAEDHIKSEIKAVTFHQLDVKKINNVYKTIIVLDI